MSYKTKFTVSIFAVALIALVTYFASAVYRQTQESSMKACLFSLNQSIIDSFKTGNINDNYLNNEWKVLSQTETKDLLNSLIKSGKTDCGKIEEVQEGKDYWGDTIKIALRQSSADKMPEVKVWSSGIGTLENTKGDIQAEKLEQK